MDLRQQLGTNLKRLREGASLSQEQLMLLSGVHRTQISNYERGETEPQAEVLARLSRAWCKRRRVLHRCALARQPSTIGRR